MSTRPILKFLGFLAASATVGLAAAFIAVVVRPELIARQRAPGAGPRARSCPGQTGQHSGAQHIRCGAAGDRNTRLER